MSATPIGSSFSAQATEFFRDVPELRETTVRALRRFSEIVPRSLEAIVTRPLAVRTLPETVKQFEAAQDREAREKTWNCVKGAALVVLAVVGVLAAVFLPAILPMIELGATAKVFYMLGCVGAWLVAPHAALPAIFFIKKRSTEKIDLMLLQSRVEREQGVIDAMSKDDEALNPAAYAQYASNLGEQVDVEIASLSAKLTDETVPSKRAELEKARDDFIAAKEDLIKVLNHYTPVGCFSGIAL